ncbi:MAG: polar amino acid transport system substrate-binding protein [Motiliproteus sp.]|jgi:polar amino acid transport system substrate-binding protein
MLFKPSLFWACCIFLLPCQAFANQAEDPSRLQASSEPPNIAPVRWMSEQYPPYNHTDKQGVALGLSVEMLAAIWKQAGLPEQPIEFLPWARSYTRLLRTPNTALFSMTYTPKREQLFRFVGPIVATRIVLLAPLSAGLHIADASDIGALRVGVVRDDIGASLLTDLGIPEDRVVYSNQADNLIQLLHRGRVDAIAYSYGVAVWNMRQAGIDPGLYESIFTLLQGELGFAFHAQTPDLVIDRLQHALTAIEESGEADSIRQRFLGEPVRPTANRDRSKSLLILEK